MNRRTTSNICSVSLALSLAATALAPGSVQAVTATWINGNGNYSDDTKWDTPIPPCNAGSTTFDVIIPGNIGTVSDDVTVCEVNTLTLGNNSTLKILPGNSYTVLNQADIFGIVWGAGGNFTANAAVFPGNRARAWAELGSVVTIGAIDYSSTGLTGNATLFSATNTGSLLDLSALQSLNAAFNDSSSISTSHKVIATDDAVIDLWGLQSTTSPVRNEDRLTFEVTDTAIIDLSSLAMITTAGGRTNFSVHVGASQTLPALQNVNDTEFWVWDAATLTANGSPWDYSSAGLQGNASIFSATNAGSSLNMSSLQSLNAAYNDSSSISTSHKVIATDGAMIELWGLQSATSPVRNEDRLTFEVTDTAIIDLSSLAMITTAGGRTNFSVHVGASQTLPALQNVNDTEFWVWDAATLTANGSPWDYSSAGLQGNASIFSATNAGSSLNMSSLQSLNAAYNDSSSISTSHKVIATDGAVIDLSGLQSATSPVRNEDRLTFEVTDTAIIDLSSLAMITTAGGRTNFSVHIGASQTLPALQNVNDTEFWVWDAATLTANGSPWDYSSAGLQGNASIFSATNAGSSLNMSSLQSLNAAYNDSSSISTSHKVIATDGAVIDLSGLETVNTPVRGEDTVKFSVNTNAIIDISSLKTISGNGGAVFDLQTGGEIWVGDLSNAQSNTWIGLNDADTRLRALGSLLLTPSTRLIAVPDAIVSVGEIFSFNQADETRIDLESGVVHFDGAGPQFVEAGGFDIGTLTPVGPNFAFGQMIVGTDAQATTVNLRDAVDNGNGHVLCGPGEEALYLLGLPADPMDPTKIVNGLRILGGSTLVLNGIPLYTMQDGALVDVRTWFGPSQNVLAYNLNNSSGFIALGSSPDTDADADGEIDVSDNCVIHPNGPSTYPAADPRIQRDTNGDGYGNICDPDLDNNGVVQAADLAILKPLFFTGDPDADLDGSGVVNTADLAIMKKMFFGPPGPSCVAP